MCSKYPGVKLESALQRGDKIENLWSRARVLYTTANQVISRRWKDGNGYKMCINEKHLNSWRCCRRRRRDRLSNLIGHFRVHYQPLFQRISAKSLLWRWVFIYIGIRTSYHNTNFALRLALKERLMELGNGLYCFLTPCWGLNPLAAEWALRALIDFTLSNARRFYSSMGNPLA